MKRNRHTEEQIVTISKGPERDVSQHGSGARRASTMGCPFASHFESRGSTDIE